MVASSAPSLGTKVTKTYSSPSASRSSKICVSPNAVPLDMSICPPPRPCGTWAKVPANSLETRVVSIPSSTSFTNTSNWKNCSPLYLISSKNSISLAFFLSSALLFVAGLFTRTFTVWSNFTGNSISSTFLTTPTDLAAMLDALFRGIERAWSHVSREGSKVYPILSMSTQSLL
ncbi:hypothetical protein HanRHA438_Chr03g0125791 [Helianthus annuus]|nr:hypothetical protein HanRHA438_Chr03g0125791 [Helianthus annuus]